MSAVNEWVVREYFELLGYLVSQPRKYSIPARQKLVQEEIDLVVFNPQVEQHRLPEHLIWGAEDFQCVARAIIGVRGGHTARFYASTLEQEPELLRFVQPDSIRYASRILGSSEMARVLCVPRLPASGELKEQTIDMLKKNGVDGVVSFQTMLMELIRHVDVSKNYEKSDLLQILRLLKNYDLIQDEQLIFGRPRKKLATRAEPASGASGKTSG